MIVKPSELRAEVNPNFKYKFLLIGIVSLAIGLYHFIDPIFVYPKMRPASEAYAALEDETDDDGELQREWSVVAETNDWPDAPPKYKPEELTTNTIYSYGVGGLFTFVVGLPCMITFLRCLGQWIELKDDRLVNAKGKSVAMDQITKIDKSRWEKKGIAKVIYSADGKDDSFVIDDLKFDRVITDQIMEQVEQKVGIDLIEGGKSEAVYREERAEAELEKERKRLEAEAEEE